MNFLLFNLTVVAALAYLFLHAAPPPTAPQAIAAAPQAVAAAPPEAKPAPPPEAKPAPPILPTIEAVIDVPVAKPQPLREGRATPAAPPEPRPADRRKDLDRLIQDMELMAAKKLGQ
jgi:hypothetical protein